MSTQLALSAAEGEKGCPGCGQVKPLYAFYQRKTGRGQYASYCKACTSTRALASYHEKVRRLNALKLARGCDRCGFVDRYPAKLTYHHRDPRTKEFAVSDGVNRGFPWPKIQAEIDKCELLCLFCHVEEHGDPFDQEEAPDGATM